MVIATHVLNKIRAKLTDISLYEAINYSIERIFYSKEFILRFDQYKSFPQESRRISVAITHYERPDLLIVALKNIFHDQRVSEIIILDDGSSSENFLRCANNLKNFEAKVKLFRRRQNFGPFATSIQVCSLCSNPWCILLDSDNTVFDSYLNAIFSLNSWQENTIYCPDYAFPHYDFRSYNNSTFDFNGVCNLQKSSQLLTTNFIFSCFMNGGNYFLNTKMFTEILQPYLKLRPDASDSIMRNYIWLSQGNKLQFLKNASYYHRVHAQSNWLLNSDRGFIEYHILAKKFEENRPATLENLLLDFRSMEKIDQNIEQISF